MSIMYVTWKCNSIQYIIVNFVNLINYWYSTRVRQQFVSSFW